MARRAMRARQPGSADGGARPRIVPPASFGTRVAAFAIDSILVVAVVGAVISAVQWPLSGLLSIVVITLAFVVPWTAPVGRSFGGGFLRLQVIGTDGESLSAARALLRLAVLVAGTILFFLGPLSALSDERRQAWHDKVARSYVIPQKGLGETLRDLESAVINRSTRGWYPRPIVVTPRGTLPVVVVFAIAAVSSGVFYGLVWFLSIFRNV